MKKHSRKLLIAVIHFVLFAGHTLAIGQEHAAEATVITSPQALPPEALILDARAVLQNQTFWDNRDWAWYERQIPLLETPSAEVDTTWYYRWELLTKHLTYGSPEHGYTFTEFIDRPAWSGTYGSISCPAGHQLYEARWLRDPRIARDFARYWFRVPGAQPRRYSTWLADAVWSFHLVHPDDHFVVDLLPDLQANHEAWQREHFDPNVGMFWQHGMADGMETNINSRQTENWFSGAEGYRPTLNAYLWADARAIARIAQRANDTSTAAKYSLQADDLKAKVQSQLWDPRRQFFFHMTRSDEEKDGSLIKARTLTYQTGRFAGSPHGRELIGYVPWQFSLPDPGQGFEQAWRFLSDPDYFQAQYGPTTVERNDPQFLISPNCCVWSGQSWPYATTQTLKALANVLQQYPQDVVTKRDYWKLLLTYAKTHRKGGFPYIAEATHPDTGSWSGHDHFNHSEHYFHSGYADLVITGLIGLTPREDDTLEVNPLAPDEWDYFALDNVVYRGHRLAIIWDRTGIRYGRGAGLQVFVDGQSVARTPHLERLTATLGATIPAAEVPLPLNYAVNNSLQWYPRATASFTSSQSNIQSVNDGNFWYHRSPPNRWSTEGSSEGQDWCEIDFGKRRLIHTVKLYFLDDEQAAPIDYQPIDSDANTPPRPSMANATLAPPDGYELLYAADTAGPWQPIPQQAREPERPAGRLANVIRFPAINAQRIRLLVTHAAGKRTGLTEFEIWGDGQIPVPPADPPSGNLAANPRGEGYPQASSSWTSRFDRSVGQVNDGLVNFRPEPMNRWTSYESPNSADWLAIDFGKVTAVGRVELYIYDDHGGVQPPQDYRIEIWSGDQWTPVPEPKKTPPQAAGSQVNTVVFPQQMTDKLRVVFMHRGAARSGLTEIAIWEN